MIASNNNDIYEDDNDDYAQDAQGSERRLSRTLTQRYDMHSLRALQDLEVTTRVNMVFFIQFTLCSDHAVRE